MPVSYTHLDVYKRQQLNKDPTESYLKQTIKLIKTTKNIFNNINTDIYYINNNTKSVVALIMLHISTSSKLFPILGPCTI